MLDPGRYLAEAIYFLQYTLAHILWATNRALLSIAVIGESINRWITANAAYFVELLTTTLSAPLGGMFILALTALGAWYALNNLVPTSRWVDPGKLATYGFLAFFFFSSPVLVIGLLEDLRLALASGIDPALLEGASGTLFDVAMDGTDPGLPTAIPDTNDDGVIGSFDLVCAFMRVVNLDELDSQEFPAEFETAYFPFGDPATIDLSDESDQALAKALASDGIQRLTFALFTTPTAIAEHFLRLALTSVALFLYLGVPFAMLFAFFVYTQAFLMAYLRQFINMLIETLMSVLITAVMLLLLRAAAEQGTGLFIGASVIVCLVLVWRIQSALRLAAAAFNLFGGSMMTGGVGAAAAVKMGQRAVTGAAGLAGAALTGGGTLALGGAALAAAGALQADGQAGGGYLGTDPAQTEQRVRQLQTMAGYVLGQNKPIRQVIESGHEARSLARHFGEEAAQTPDVLDYLRAGSSLSGRRSSPWVAMRLSPSLQAAYDQIGGQRPNAHEEAPITDSQAASPPANTQNDPDGGQAERPLVRLAGGDAPFTQALGRSLQRLDPSHPDDPVAQALMPHHGPQPVKHLQTSLAQHGLEAVTAVMAAIQSQVQAYREEGMDDGQILAAFQQGQVLAAIRAGAPLSTDQLTAVADVVLRPQRQVSRSELVQVIQQQVAAGETNDRAVARVLGMPTDFGNQTGNIRGVIAGVQQLELSAETVMQLTRQLEAGLNQTAQVYLTQQGHPPEAAQAFISDLAAIPPHLIVAQTTAAPQKEGET